MKALMTLVLMGFSIVQSSGDSLLGEARALVGKADVETLFLKYGSIPAEELPEQTRQLLAAELLKGAKLASNDAFIAHGLLSRAIVLHESVEALVSLALVELELQQKGGAIEHLDKALHLDPKNPKALMARGELAFGDGDHGAAIAFFERAQKQKAPGARSWIEKAKKARDEEEKSQAIFQKTEEEIQQRLEKARREATRDWLTQIYEEEKRETNVPGGVRKNQTQRFEYSYTAARKTQGELNQFEWRIGKLLDKAYDHVSKTLSHQLSKKIPVLLMTPEEYAAKFAHQPVARAGAFWNGQHIVVNGQTEVDTRFAEIMVHELTHAFVQDIIGQRSTIPRWANEGLAEYMEHSVSRQSGEFPRDQWMLLKQLKKRTALPGLNELDALFVRMGDDVHIAYALSAYAVHHLIKNRGLRAYIDMLKEMRMLKNSIYLDKTMEKHLKINTKGLEKEIQDKL